MNGAAQTGPNLQALIAGQCLKAHLVDTLTDAQKTAIENLSHSQIQTLVEVRQLVGAINGSDVI
jgi:fumarylacetoacetate (FAA) hydrolase family protein